MILINGGRGAGKTRALIRWALEDPEHRVIITMGEQRALWVHAMANRMTNTTQVQLNVVSLSSWRHWYRGRLPMQVAVDELGDLIAYALGVVPDVATGLPVELRSLTDVADLI